LPLEKGQNNSLCIDNFLSYSLVRFASDIIIMSNNHTTESSAASDSDAGNAGAMTTATPTAVGESSSVYIPATAGSPAVAVQVSSNSSTNVGTSAAPVSGTSAAEITFGANRLASELREFMQAHEQSFLVTSSAVTNISSSNSNSLESIGSASWPAVKEDATADLQLATCRKLREVSWS
jgi:hypothetical protein